MAGTTWRTEKIVRGPVHGPQVSIQGELRARRVDLGKYIERLKASNFQLSGIKEWSAEVEE